mgnify:CR=1 FL=1
MREINPKETKRAKAYELWMKAPNPMVTFFKTLDVTPLVNKSKKSIKKALFSTFFAISTCNFACKSAYFK